MREIEACQFIIEDVQNSNLLQLTALEHALSSYLLGEQSWIPPTCTCTNTYSQWLPPSVPATAMQDCDCDTHPTCSTSSRTFTDVPTNTKPLSVTKVNNPLSSSQIKKEKLNTP